MDVELAVWSTPVTLGQQDFEAAKTGVTYWEMKRGQEVIALRLRVKKVLFGIYPKDKVAMLIGNDNNRKEVEEPRKTKKVADRLDPKEHMKDDCREDAGEHVCMALKWEVHLLSVMGENT